MSAVVRAPYWPRSARKTSCQREWSAPSSAPRESNTHLAPAVDHGGAQLDPGLLDAVDVGLEAARVERCGTPARAPRRRSAPSARCVLDQRRQQLRRLDQRLLGRLAVARVDVGELRGTSGSRRRARRRPGCRRRCGCAWSCARLARRAARRSLGSGAAGPRRAHSRCRGASGSAPCRGAIAFILARTVLTWASTVRSMLSVSLPQTRSSSASRENTWPGREASVFSRPYS